MIHSRQALLQIKNLSVSFKQGKTILPAVNGIDFSIFPQEIIGIVGESGSGKSVSMLSIMKLLPPHAKISIDTMHWTGENIKQFSPLDMRKLLGKNIAYIYQEPSQSYDPLVNIFDTFVETYRAHDKSIHKNKILMNAVTLMTEVGILDAEERIKNYFHQFSGGMIQRVQIALALAHSPALLIADEPTTSLDVTTQQVVVELLIRLCKKRNMAMFFISHDFALVSSIVDRIMIMQDGKIVENGSTNDIIYYPKHKYTKQLLAATIKFGDKYEK